MLRVDTLPEWQQRILVEKRELDERLGKLVAFIGTGPYRALAQLERVDLRKQRTAMNTYSNVLARRIARFGKATP